jgi:glucose/arabinose dehydrogenase
MREDDPRRVAVIRFLWVLLIGGCVAADAPPPAGNDQAVGQHFLISATALPAPSPETATANPSVATERPSGALPSVPPGFTVSVFAENFDHARNLLTLPDGDILLAEQEAGRVTRIHVADGHQSDRSVFAEGLDRPHGLAFHDGHVYVGDTRAVWRYAPDGSSKEQVTADGALGEGKGHITRNIAFAPDGQHFYVSIGSHGNIDEEPEPYAAIREFPATGGVGTKLASGLRNPVDLHFYPGSDTLWTVVNERDGLGDGLAPDYLTHVERGGFYGWPYAYNGPHPQPGRLGSKRPDLVAATITGDVLFQSHSAPLGLVFYDGKQFPGEYQGDAFVSLHGSWNSGVPTGYKIVRVRFRDGRPIGGYENFLTGFWIKGTNPARVWGRPVGLTVAGDGSLLIADDVGQRIWRVTWTGR